MVGEVIYIFYSYSFGLYFVSLTAMTIDHNHGCHQKDTFWVFYYVRIHISQFCTFWTDIQVYHITRYVSSYSYQLASVSKLHAYSRAVVVHTLHRGQRDTRLCPLIS